jgi:hypothetical protein
MSDKRALQRDMRTVALTDAIKRGIDLEVGAVKHDLRQWLDHMHDSSDSAAVTIALLEAALDHFFAERTGRPPPMPTRPSRLSCAARFNDAGSCSG